MKTIVVLLPGIAGTSLDNHLFNAWPDEVITLTTVGFERAALHILQDPSLEVEEPVAWSLPRKLNLGYNAFRHFFEAAGFHSVVFSVDHRHLPAKPREKLLVGFGYDWRNDNGPDGTSQGSAGDLRTLLEALDGLYAGTDYRVFLVGHSMGGLVSRAYLENPASRNDPWYGKVAGLITLGTPHLGAPLAVDAITGRITRLDTNYDRLIHDFVNGSWSVSTYELLPPPARQFIRVDGTCFSIFDEGFQDTAAWKWLQTRGINTAKLERARAFFEALEYDPDPALPPYYCVFGLAAPVLTCQSFTYDAGVGRLIEVADELGDSVVPRWSASFEGRPVEQIYNPPGNVNHLQITGNPHVLRQVATWIGVTPPVVHFTTIEAEAGAAV
ncbi:MAG TPA: alpha/beta fold hydrolase [Longimicrobium sp.]|nr:alpha/beta fold hydrolase [Longimicrobium sp.]